MGAALWGAGGGVGHAIADGGREAATSSMQLLRVKGGGVSTIYVDNTAALNAAIKSAKDGDVIKLAPGLYEGLSVKGGVSFQTSLTITSADPSKPAVLTDFRLVNVTGLTFRDLEFAASSSVETKGDAHWAFSFVNARNIHFDKVYVHGSLDGDPSNDVQGINIRRGSNITVTDCEFEQLERGMAIGSVDHIRIERNYIHDLRSDGMDFAEVSFVEVRANVFTNFRPIGKDHPDAIQFWTSGTKEISHDILVTGNAILRGDGGYTQGIFFRDQTKEMPFERVTISDNLLVNTGYNAIRVNGVKDLALTNNTLVSAAGENKTWLRISSGDGVIAHGNRGAIIDFDDNVINLTTRNNTITRVVSDLGVAATKDWLEAHPDMAARVSVHVLKTPPSTVSYNDPVLDGSVVTVSNDDPWEDFDAADDPFFDGSTLFAGFDYSIV